MITSPSYPDFVLKIDENGIWRKFNFSFTTCDYTVITDETFESFEDASEYMGWANEQIGRVKAARLNAL